MIQNCARSPFTFLVAAFSFFEARRLNSETPRLLRRFPFPRFPVSPIRRFRFQPTGPFEERLLLRCLRHIISDTTPLQTTNNSVCDFFSDVID